MDKYNIAENEYNKLLNNSMVNPEVINNGSFRQAFIDRFLFIGDNYSIKIENGEVILESKSNIPEATNGIYKGYKDAKKVVFKFEKEHLSVYEESATIYCIPNSLDTMTYNSMICAYKNGIENAFSSYNESREVNKDFMPSFALHSSNGSNMVEIPYLTVGNALTCTPVTGKGMFKWESGSSCRQNDGLVFASQVSHQNETSEIRTNSWGMVDASHFNVLHYNTLPFAYNQTQGGVSNNEWRTPDGRLISIQELEDMKNEYISVYKDFTVKNR